MVFFCSLSLREGLGEGEPHENPPPVNPPKPVRPKTQNKQNTLLIKLIKCQTLPGKSKDFATAQRAWATLKTAPGFHAQCGGFVPNQTPPLAIILAFWDSLPNYYRFMKVSHDQIFNHNKQALTYNPQESSTALYQTSHPNGKLILKNLHTIAAISINDEPSNLPATAWAKTLHAHALTPTDKPLFINWHHPPIQTLLIPNLLPLRADWLVRSE